VSAALASAMETLRQNSIVPTRDGFEFSDIMAAFPKTVRSSRGRALAITKTFELAGSRAQVPAIAPNPDVEKRRGDSRNLLRKLTMMRLT